MDEKVIGQKHAFLVLVEFFMVLIKVECFKLGEKHIHSGFCIKLVHAH